MKTRSLALAAGLAVVLGVPGPARAMSDAALADIVRQRLHGDRTGACRPDCYGCGSTRLGGQRRRTRRALELRA